jgi:ADP-heptose:LPS heptosyltransferase
MLARTILFLHDTDLSLRRGAELTINQLTALGEKKGFVVATDLLDDLESVKTKIIESDLVVINSTSRCTFEKQLLRFIIDSKKKYVKIEFDYNFCTKRTIACTIDLNQTMCCDGEKFHLYRELFAGASLNIFQSPKHYESHKDFYGAAVQNHLVMPPTVEVDAIRVSQTKDETTIPFFGDLSFLKGGKAYLEYAAEHPDMVFEVYGANRMNEPIPQNVFFKDMIPNGQVLEILGKTKYFFCQPYWPEPSGRLAAEAFLSGCEMIANDRIGTFSFDFYPTDIDRAKREMKEAPENFWDAISKILTVEKPTTKKSGKILVHKTSGGLGDIFYSIPALYALKSAYADVAFAVEPRLVPFFQKRLKGIEIIDETLSEALEKNYDKVIELGNYPAYMGGFKLPHAIKYHTHDRIGQHAIQHYIDAVAKEHSEVSIAIDFPYFNRETDFENPYYTLHAGAGLLLKAWPLANFSTIVEQIQQHFPDLGCKIIVGPGDPDPSEFLQDKSNIELITGDLEAVGTAFSGALFHIGNDSGISHIADAYNLPTVGIYGPTGPGAWGNFSELTQTIWGKTGSCDRKCDYEVLTTCADRVCLSSIKTRTVMGAVFKLLGQAYPELLETEILNPALETQLTESDVTLHIDGNEFCIHFTEETVKEEVLQILSGNFNMQNPQVLSLLDFLREQYIIVGLANFHKKMTA